MGLRFILQHDDLAEPLRIFTKAIELKLKSAVGDRDAFEAAELLANIVEGMDICADTGGTIQATFFGSPELFLRLAEWNSAKEDFEEDDAAEDCARALPRELPVTRETDLRPLREAAAAAVGVEVAPPPAPANANAAAAPGWSARRFLSVAAAVCLAVLGAGYGLDLDGDGTIGERDLHMLVARISGRPTFVRRVEVAPGDIREVEFAYAPPGSGVDQVVVRRRFLTTPASYSAVFDAAI